MPASPINLSPNGNNVSIASFATTVSIGEPSTIFQAGDILRVAVGIDNSGITVSGIASAGLTFARRGGGSGTGGAVSSSMSVWDAVLPAPQTGFSAVVTASGSFDDIVAIWCVVRGCTSGAPYDPMLPVIETGAPPATATFSTVFGDDLLYAAVVGDNDAWLSPPPSKVTPAGWVWLNGASNTGGFGAVSLGVYTQSVSSPQSGATFDVTDPISNGSVFFVDAFTGDSAGAGGGRPFLIKPKLGI